MRRVAFRTALLRKITLLAVGEEGFKIENAQVSQQAASALFLNGWVVAPAYIDHHQAIIEAKDSEFRHNVSRCRVLSVEASLHRLGPG